MSTRLFLATFLLLLAAACGKSMVSGLDSDKPRPPGPLPQDPLQCELSSRIRWQFVQPDPIVNRSVDVLFVVDTSASLDAERARIARDFPAFVRRLPVGADYRIAVMEAHGGASEFSGRLYSPEGVPKVLSSSQLTTDQIQKYLKKSLCETADDADFAEGEAPLYSFRRSTQPDRLGEIRAQGFYRENAGLSLVFVTDENDLCFRPELHGYKKWPDYVKDGGGREVKAYEQYCLGSDGNEAVTPESIKAEVKALKGDMPIAVGGVVHVNPENVPWPGQDSIGHGIIELVKSFNFDSLIDLCEKSYAEGLAKLADLSTLISRLKADFGLSASDPFVIESLRAEIDGVAVPITYDEGTRTVHVEGSNLGQGGSVVNIEACPVVADTGPIGS